MKKKPTPAQMKKAKHHYENARKHQEQKDYIAAALEYEKAFAIFASPEFIFNAAQVYRLAGKHEEALERYERYLSLDPDGRGAADSRANITKLKEEIQRQKEAQAEEERQRSLEKERLQSEREALFSKEAARDSDQDPHTESKTLKIAGLATMGLGAVALGVGVKFAVDAGNAESLVESNIDNDSPWDQSVYQDGKDAERNMFILYGIGATAVVTGGVLYFLGRGEAVETPHRVTVGPLTQNTGGILVMGNF